MVMAESITTYCQTATACKERFRGDVAHDVFAEMLKGITAKKELLELYYPIMSDFYKRNGSDKSKQIKEVQAQIDNLKQRNQNAPALMLDAELLTAEYRNIRNAIVPEIECLEQMKVSLLTSKDDYRQYLDKGIPLLQNIDKHWLAADLEGKQRIVGSIFPEKLIFEKNSYGTKKENPVLSLIAAIAKGSSRSKKGQASKIADLSGWVPRTGFEPAHPCERCDLNTVRLPISPPGQV